MASMRGRDVPSRMGVGIPGIKARLRQFGGELVVRSGQNGTRLHGVMPVHAMPAGGGPEIVAPLGAGLISPPLVVRHDITLDVLHHHDATVRGTDQS